MPPLRLPVQMTNYTNSLRLGDRITGLVAGNSLPAQALTKVIGYGKRLIHFLKHPDFQKHILKLGIFYLASFAIVFALLAAVGFGPLGVGAGTLAAAFQSVVYGGFVPAGGLFATLTSMGMLGTLMPVLLGLAALVAVGLTVMVSMFYGRR